jgi:DNA topoisomerase IB
MKTNLCALLRKAHVDEAAHAAATTPITPGQPSKAQLKAGNYAKGHTRIAGLDISIENPTGSVRHGSTLSAHYGYIRRTEGADGDHLDVFVKPGTPSNYEGPVFVIDQHIAGQFDEHKVMLGWAAEADARRAYLASYQPGWKGLHAITKMTVPEFKEWMAAHACFEKADWSEEDHPRDEQGRFGESGLRNEGGKWVGSGGRQPSAADQARLSKLGVPPAWTDVKLSADPEAALQVVGKDAKGRSQYIYSAEHTERAAAEKFARLSEFNKVAGGVREQAYRDMHNASLTDSQRDTAAALALISETGFRAGSDADTGAEKKAFGASNLLSSHVTVDGDTLHFNFTGKKGVDQSHSIHNPALAKYVVGREGRLFDTNDAKIRTYMKQTAGIDFKVKDFRTWHGTAEAVRAISAMPKPANDAAFKKARTAVGKVVAAKLGNTPSVALASYINPAVFAQWGK